MFTDGRSKRVLFVAHCLLNQNAISDGTADYPACHADIVRMLLDAQVGIVQMNCPELCCLGLDRGDVHGAERPVVEETPASAGPWKRTAPGRSGRPWPIWWRSRCRSITNTAFRSWGIVGANRSPQLRGGDHLGFDREVEGRGAFMEAIAQRLERRGSPSPCLG